MSLRRTSLLVIYFLFIFQLQQNFLTVSSRLSLTDTNHKTLPFNATKLDLGGFEGKTRDLAVVIKRRGGGGRGGGGGGGRGGGGGGSRGVGGGARSRSRGGAGVIYPGGSHSRPSSNSMSLKGSMWLSLLVIAGLVLV